MLLETGEAPIQSFLAPQSEIEQYEESRGVVMRLELTWLLRHPTLKGSSADSEPRADYGIIHCQELQCHIQDLDGSLQ